MIRVVYCYHQRDLYQKIAICLLIILIVVISWPQIVLWTHTSNDLGTNGEPEWQSYVFNPDSDSFDGIESFEYPNGWIVAAIAPGTITITPPESEFLSDAKPGLNNAIVLTDKQRLIESLTPSFDGENFGMRFKMQITSTNTWNNYRRIELSYDATNPYDFGAVGFFRADPGMVGIRQSICNAGQQVKCLHVFKQLLDSIRQRRQTVLMMELDSIWSNGREKSAVEIARGAPNLDSGLL